MLTLDPDLAPVIDAYRLCEFATLGKDGTPIPWPAATIRQPDGTLLLTTSIAFPQKAFNIRRDGRVALLFSDPTGSGLDNPPQILIRGTAVCPDEIVATPEGTEAYWKMLYERQPSSHAFARAPLRWLMDWYYLRLLITVTPTEILTLSSVDLATPAQTTSAHLLGADELARRPSAVLGARNANGDLVLARTRPVATEDGFAVEVPEGVAEGPAALMVHEHDEHLADLMNVLVRGQLTQGPEGTWLLKPERMIEPMPGRTPREQIATLRARRAQTRKYLAQRGLERPKVRWDRLRELQG